MDGVQTDNAPLSMSSPLTDPDRTIVLALMGMIPESTIAEIRERTDLVALISEHVNLKRVGASFKGLCPFHSEKSPSFYVHPDRQFFHCFGCQASGDCFSFLTRLEASPFPEVARTLAERAGVKLEVLDQKEEQRFQQARERTARLAALMDAACGYYVKQLEEHPLSEMARAELSKRGIAEKAAKDFRLGYAPHGWDALCQWLKAKDFSAEDAEQLGLCVRRKRGEGYYDRFRHRLMFPITDHQGKIIAFSGRALDPPADEPLSNQSEPGAKYINSPENPLYKKGQVLYGLFEGRVSIRKKSTVILCEGNFDLVALHQAGLDYAVAPMGTALTPEQAKLIRRFAGNVVLLFDGDRAGYEATWKAIPLLAKAGLSSKVVPLPMGSDPDTFLRENGADGLKTRVESAKGAVSYLIDESSHRSAGDPTEKAQAIEALGPLLAATLHPVETDLHIQRIRQKFGISDEGAVRRQLRRGVRANRGNNRRTEAKQAVGNQESRERNERTPLWERSVPFSRAGVRTGGRSIGQSVAFCI